MSAARDLRSTYQTNAIATATPARLLIMLLDRLVLDAERGQAAVAAGDREEANRQLQHAQAIVTHLETTLEVDGMPAGRELLALYDYLRRRLVTANVAQDADAAAEAVSLSRELCETWRQAALLAAQSA
jgi:flagellar protein FliS